jgi:hypothetical protein
MANAQPPEKLEWEEPPPGARRKGSRWDPIARALRQHPGKWACIGRNIPTGIMTTINTAGLKCFRPEGAFEAVARNHTNRWTADVYARYVGDDGEYL